MPLEPENIINVWLTHINWPIAASDRYNSTALLVAAIHDYVMLQQAPEAWIKGRMGAGRSTLQKVIQNSCRRELCIALYDLYYTYSCIAIFKHKSVFTEYIIGTIWECIHCFEIDKMKFLVLNIIWIIIICSQWRYKIR